MLITGIPIFIIVTLLPGLLAVRLLRKELHALDALLYAMGLGLLFNILVGAVANFSDGINLLSVAVVYFSLVVPLGVFSYAFGKSLPLKWHEWKPLAIPAGLYLLALGLQLQTTLISPNLVGSDIHLEYFVSNMVLEQDSWNPMYTGTTLNACLGLTLLIPVYKLLTGLSLIWVFNLICPMVFAVLPVVLYRMFRLQFGTVVSVLAVVFFVTMPMFTMDMVQLVRQQQSMLFFVLVVLVLMDTNLNIIRKVALGGMFAVSTAVTHLGMAIGIVGYLIAGVACVFLLRWWWQRKVTDETKDWSAKWGMVCLLVICIGAYYGYYHWVNAGRMTTSITIPAMIISETIKPGSTELSGAVSENSSCNDTSASFFERFAFLSPLTKEPLAQTAIGLDFSKASALGKVWRVLQYLVELCLVVGFFKVFLRPGKKIKVEYMAFVIASGFILVGMYVLSNYGWGLGATRIWQITLLFMSPMFVIGAEAIGQWMTRAKSTKVGLWSTLAILVPYFVFNSGVVFEIAKLELSGFIDVPYSVAVSGHRVDVASVFTDLDVEAMDWLKQRFLKEGGMIFTDTHGGNLAVQRIGTYLKEDDFKYLWQIDEDDAGYVFLREWNVVNDMLTIYGDYGSRQSIKLGDFKIVKEKIDKGIIVFDNGARVILIN